MSVTPQRRPPASTLREVSTGVFAPSLNATRLGDSERLPLQRGELVGGARDRHHGHGGQAELLEVVGARDGRHREVHLLVRQGLQGTLEPFRLHRDGGGGKAVLHEAQRLDEGRRAATASNGDAHEVLLRSTQRSRIALQRLAAFEPRGGSRKESPPLFLKLRPVGAAIERGEPEGLFQVAHELADGRLGLVQRLVGDALPRLAPGGRAMSRPRGSGRPAHLARIGSPSRGPWGSGLCSARVGSRFMKRARDDDRLAALFERLDCLLFDCDGIVFDSNGFKQQAMQHALFDRSPVERRAMAEYWRAHGGQSRFAKFRHFFTQIAPVEDIEASVAVAVERFGGFSRAAYDHVRPLPEALRLSRAVGPARCYVASGAAQDELEEVFASKGLSGHFARVLGSPTPKLELVRGVLEEGGYAPERTVLIGDGAIDFRVCQELHLHFVFVARFSEWQGALEQLEGAEPVSWAEDWQELLSALPLTGG